MTDRNEIIGPLMLLIEKVIKEEMEEFGVPSYLRPNPCTLQTHLLQYS